VFRGWGRPFLLVAAALSALTLAGDEPQDERRLDKEDVEVEEHCDENEDENEDENKEEQRNDDLDEQSDMAVRIYPKRAIL